MKVLHFRELLAYNYMFFLHIKIPFVFFINFPLRQQLSELTIEIFTDELHFPRFYGQVAIDVFGSLFLELCLLGVIQVFDLFLGLTLLHDDFIAFASFASEVALDSLHEFGLPRN
jgi:hypothetical protein